MIEVKGVHWFWWLFWLIFCFPVLVFVWLTHNSKIRKAEEKNALFWNLINANKKGDKDDL